VAEHPPIELFIYATFGGIMLGIILGMTRLHMTGRATFVFTMLYYFLFTGLLNIDRVLTGGFEPIHTIGFYRALLFALSAALVVHVIRMQRQKQLRDYMDELRMRDKSTH
jgi:uncharacterized membrane protein required for colicin V production